MSKKIKNKNTKKQPAKSKPANNVQGGLVNLIREAKKMQGKIEDVKEDIKDELYTGESGDGDSVKVEAIVDGNLELKELKISDKAYEEDKEMLNDLIILSVNKALKLSQENKEKKISEITSGFAFPGLF